MDVLLVLDRCGKYCQCPALRFSVCSAVFQGTISAFVSLNGLFPIMMGSLYALVLSSLEGLRNKHSHQPLSSKDSWKVVCNYFSSLVLVYRFPEATCGIKLQIPTM